MLEALDREPDRWNISSLQMIVSSGAIWSEETKRRLLAYNPSLTLWDSLGSSEAFGLARSISTRDHIASTGRFVPTPDVRVLDEMGTRELTGIGDIGRLAVRGPSPLGYHEPGRAPPFSSSSAETDSRAGDGRASKRTER